VGSIFIGTLLVMENRLIEKNIETGKNVTGSRRNPA
jgi:hypothetical protein